MRATPSSRAPDSTRRRRPHRVRATVTASRTSLLAVSLCLAVATLSSCGGGGSSTTTTSIRGVAAKSCGAVEYGGDGTPQALVVSDLPMQGDSAERSRQQVEAIRLVFEQRDWKAGPTTVAFQPCDDSIAKTGLWDPATCRANAAAYGRDPKVLGVIGTYNSGCAAEEIPILNRAGVAMISPGNTAVCLTEPSTTCTSGQPGSLYPSGKRNYVRVVPNDAFQGAALAEFAKRRHVEHPFVLYAADDPTSTGQAVDFRNAARAVGLKVAGTATWNPKAKSYRALFERVKQSGADGVLLAGLIEENGAQVIRDKVAVLGSNAKLPLIAFDGFAQQSTIDGAGQAAKGMFASVPGQAPESLTGDGSELVGKLQDELGGKPVEQFAPYAGEAAAIMLDSIAAAGPHRDGVVKAMFVSRGGGILGHYSIGRSGDPAIGPITVLRADSTFAPSEQLTPPLATVTAARG
jgi:branched-chain amino acid transport system substrate-binding protein